jgi:glycosyltransferase involved in cell wall biosynthesis
MLAGDINEFRFDAVLAFAEAIERHNRRSKDSIEFVVLGDVAEQLRAPLSALDGVSLLGRLPHSVCLNAMQKADVLYLPLAFSRHATRISRYSMPTKLPEYLATGKPVLFHAPSDSALFQVAERYDLNPRLATIDPFALDTFIERWQNEPHHADERVSKTSVALAEEFDINTLSKSFQAAFN